MKTSINLTEPTLNINGNYIKLYCNRFIDLNNFYLVILYFNCKIHSCLNFTLKIFNYSGFPLVRLSIKFFTYLFPNLLHYLS